MDVIWLGRRRGTKYFCGDLFSEQTESSFFLGDPGRSPNPTCSRRKVGEPPWKSRSPTWYTIVRQKKRPHRVGSDLGAPPWGGGGPKLSAHNHHELDSSQPHGPMLSQPERVIDLIRTGRKMPFFWEPQATAYSNGFIQIHKRFFLDDGRL